VLGFVAALAFFPVVVWFMCSGRRGSFAHRVGQALNLVFLLAAAGLSLFLFGAGQKAHWRSEGAGILFVGLMAIVLAGLALVLLVQLVHYFPSDGGTEDSVEPLRVVVAIGAVVAAGALFTWAGRRTLARWHSHDAPIINIYMSADETEVVSVDNARVTKRWNAANGHHLESRPGGLDVVPTFGPAGEILLASGQHYIVTPGAGDLERGQREFYADGAALTADSRLVVARWPGLFWAPLSDPRDHVQEFRWSRPVRKVAASVTGEVGFLDDRDTAVVLAGTPPQVRSEASLPDARYLRLTFTPSGRILLAVSVDGAGVLVLPGGEVREVPSRVDLRKFVFDGPESLVVVRPDGLTEIALPGFEERDLCGPVPRDVLLAASPRHGQVFYAADQDVYRLHWPWWSRHSLARLTRLREWRPGDDEATKRR
jgi:hypothetical protein